MNINSPSAHHRWIRPGPALAGFVLTLIGLGLVGRAVGYGEWWPGFVRYHPVITPEALYQPSVTEMCAIVRRQCRTDQILVIVGGNSIFQGVGQPVTELWTRRLQELLGDRFAVVNLALRGAHATDGAAIVAETLRAEFPRQIYVANISPLTGGAPAGSDVYRYMMLEARAKGWLVDWEPREAELEHYLKQPRNYPLLRRQLALAKINAWTRHEEFWHWWSANLFFTFPTPRTPGLSQAFRPRCSFPDQEPDTSLIPLAQRFPRSANETELAIVRNFSANQYMLESDEWKAVASYHAEFNRLVRDSFPDEMKPRTLIVISRNSPYYTRQLNELERARDERAVLDSLQSWRAAGYQAFDYGSDFKDHDFGDRTHLTKSGGWLLARSTADQVLGLANRLGYLSP